MMRVSKEGIWLQGSVKKFHLIEWNNITGIDLKERKMRNFLLPFHSLSMKVLTIRLNRKKKFILLKKKLHFR